MAQASGFITEVVDRLSPLGVQAKRMFGGYGLYVEGVMMGLIADDQVYFKVTDVNRADFLAAGMGPFSYERRGRPAAVMSYYELPPDIFDDQDDLLAWARKASAAAQSAARAKARPKASRRKTTKRAAR